MKPAPFLLIMAFTSIMTFTSIAHVTPFSSTDVAFADTPIEVYEDDAQIIRLQSGPFFLSNCSIEVSFLRGKRIIPGVSREFLSKDVNVRITNPNFSGQEQTSAVFMNICTERQSGKTDYRDVFWARLFWDGVAFQSTPISVTFDFTDSSSSYYCRQEIAVVSNGYWMPDPDSGTNNFHYSMKDAL